MRTASPYPLMTGCPDCHGTGTLAPTPDGTFLCPRGCGGTPDPAVRYASIHVQRLVTVGRWIAYIDVGMVETVRDLWEAGIPTWVSCEATGCGYGP